MSRHTGTLEYSPLQKAILKAISRYRNTNRHVSSDRQHDIDWILETSFDFSRIDLQKHIAIGHYIKTLKVGLLGKSALRDHIQHALNKVSLESLVDELLKRHKADLRAQEMRSHAIQIPVAHQANQELLLESRSLDIEENQQSREQIQTKAKRLMAMDKKLLEKYAVMKKAHMALCKKYGEPYSFSSDTMSQLTTTVVSVVEEDEDIQQAIVAEAQELTEVSNFNSQRLFKAVIEPRHIVPANDKRLTTS